MGVELVSILAVQKVQQVAGLIPELHAVPLDIYGQQRAAVLT